MIGDLKQSACRNGKVTSHLCIIHCAEHLVDISDCGLSYWFLVFKFTLLVEWT